MCSAGNCAVIKVQSQRQGQRPWPSAKANLRQALWHSHFSHSLLFWILVIWNFIIVNYFWIGILEVQKQDWKKHDMISWCRGAKNDALRSGKYLLGSDNNQGSRAVCLPRKLAMTTIWRDMVPRSGYNDQLVDDAALDLGCHHLDLRHTWYQQYRHYRPHARTVSTPLANFCNNRQTQPPVACYLVICQH